MNVVVIPIAASGIQFVLTDVINQVRSVGFVDFDGKFEWMHGEPVAFKADIKWELSRLFEVGEYLAA